MRGLLKLEELALFGFSLYLYSSLVSLSWLLFPLLLLTPDISMVGYLFNQKSGAVIYNLIHHRGIAILLIIFGILIKSEPVQLAGIILFAHIALDRVAGYGLKYPDQFKHTHLYKI